MRARAGVQHCDGVLQSARLSSLEGRVWVGVQAEGSVLDPFYFGTKNPSTNPAPLIAVCNALPTASGRNEKVTVIFAGDVHSRRNLPLRRQPFSSPVRKYARLRRLSIHALSVAEASIVA
jgi:hypothetical protein